MNPLAYRSNIRSWKDVVVYYNARRWRRLIWSLLVLSFALITLAASAGVRLWQASPTADELLALAADRPMASAVLDRHGQLIYTVFADEHQPSRYTPLDSLPHYFLEYLLFFEDRSFYENGGFDLAGLTRAAVGQALHRAGAGGGSTITMQLVRALTGERERTIARKLREIAAATKLTRRLTKDEILELYVNHVPFGPVPHYGIDFAARRLFDKPPSALTEAESLLLVTLLPGAERVRDPKRRAHHFQLRRDQLQAAGRLTPATFDALVAMPDYNWGGLGALPHGVFVDRALTELDTVLQNLGHSVRDGLVVETTLDAGLNGDLSRTLKARGRADAKGTFALLSAGGEVTAYVSLGPSERGELDLLDARSVQPDSRIKPILYGLFIESLLASGVSPDSIFSYPLPKRCEVPDHDYVITDGDGEGTVPLRRALALSYNAPACWLHNHYLGLDAVNRRLAQVDLALPYPASALGTEGVPELHLAAVYAALTVGEGRYREPYFVRRIWTKDGTLLYEAKAQPDQERPFLTPEAARLVAQGLRYVVAEGTARRLAHADLAGHDLAAKTGTSRWHRGVTGVVDGYVFTHTVEGQHLGAASRVAVPGARDLLRCALAQSTCPDAHLTLAAHR